MTTNPFMKKILEYKYLNISDSTTTPINVSKILKQVNEKNKLEHYGILANDDKFKLISIRDDQKILIGHDLLQEITKNSTLKFIKYIIQNENKDKKKLPENIVDYLQERKNNPIEYLALSTTHPLDNRYQIQSVENIRVYGGIRLPQRANNKIENIEDIKNIRSTFGNPISFKGKPIIIFESVHRPDIIDYQGIINKLKDQGANEVLVTPLAISEKYKNQARNYSPAFIMPDGITIFGWGMGKEGQTDLPHLLYNINQIENLEKALFNK